MTTAQIIIVCATVLVLAASAARVYAPQARARANAAHLAVLERIGDQLENALTFGEQRAPGPHLVGQTVVVQTRRPDAQSVRGVVHGDHADKIVLAEAVYYREGGGEQAAQGTIEVPRTSISTVQVLRPTTEE